jgi:hypothetical protein
MADAPFIYIILPLRIFIETVYMRLLERVVVDLKFLLDLQPRVGNNIAALIAGNSNGP